MSKGKFKVIVIGGGPIGLGAAHALHLAGIDFVVLERRPSIVEDEGAILVVWPHTLRVMHQFGVLKKLIALGGELKHHLSFTVDGYVFNESPRCTQAQEYYGHAPIAFHRAELVKVLYDGLPQVAKEKIITNSNLATIETNATGVKVTCQNGNVYLGSIVIGADGAQSKTRRIMRGLALHEKPHRPWDSENPYISSFRLLFGTFPSPSEPGLGYDTQAHNRAAVYFSGPKRAWFFLYDKLPTPTRDHIRYTDEDIEILGAEFSEFPLTRDFKVKDVWPYMEQKGMTNLQEGIVQHWSFERIVLAGDAAHKFTPHLGLGFNDGIQDVVALCNGIQQALQETTKLDKSLDLPIITEIFESYEASRKGPESSLLADLKNSGFETRMHTWSNTFYWILSRYLVTPRWVENLIVKSAIWPEFRKGKVLDYVQSDEPMKGKVEWLYPMNSKS
ncbi:hypothetical protein N7456_011584 [Penicillium angulare]|uniref:FAD-binding domain-containing protein n=1 Tax=Penicillium angulare TaxID=116970 RepID=A0A9W9EU29_9EURO|nr:hypothetical protein N7456_011584 [Penicillium angulare]